MECRAGCAAIRPWPRGADEADRQGDDGSRARRTGIEMLEQREERGRRIADHDERTVEMTESTIRRPPPSAWSSALMPISRAAGSLRWQKSLAPDGSREARIPLVTISASVRIAAACVQRRFGLRAQSRPICASRRQSRACRKHGRSGRAIARAAAGMARHVRLGPNQSRRTAHRSLRDRADIRARSCLLQARRPQGMVRMRIGRMGVIMIVIVMRMVVVCGDDGP